MFFARVLVAKFGAWDASFELIQRRRKGMFLVFWMNERKRLEQGFWIDLGLLENWRIEGERKHGGRKLGETKWKSRMGGKKVERFWWIVNGFLRRKLDAIWQGNAWNCDSESRSGMTQQDEKTWKKYLGREEKKKKSGVIVIKSICLFFLKPQKIKYQKVCIWKDSEFDFLTEKKFGVISNRAEFGFGFPLKEEWKTKTRQKIHWKLISDGLLCWGGKSVKR